MSTATKSMGLKRICTGCGCRFYDFEKRPITCPECDIEFTGEVKVRTRRTSKVAEVKKEDPIKAEAEAESKDEGELLEEDAGVEVVSLDDAEEKSNEDSDDDSVLGEDTLDDVPDLGIKIEDEGDDETLLDEEEE